MGGVGEKDSELNAKVLNEGQGKEVVIVEQLKAGSRCHWFHLSGVFKGGREMVEWGERRGQWSGT